MTHLVELGVAQHIDSVGVHELEQLVAHQRIIAGDPHVLENARNRLEVLRASLLSYKGGAREHSGNSWHHGQT